MAGSVNKVVPGDRTAIPEFKPKLSVRRVQWFYQ